MKKNSAEQQQPEVFEYGDWVRCDGQVMYVQGSSEDEQTGRLGLQKKDASLLFDPKLNMSYYDIVYYPPEEAVKLPPVDVDEQTLKSFFRLETTPWELCEKGLYPFSDHSGSFVLSDDDLKAFAVNLSKADGIIMDNWTDQFVFRNRGAHVRCPIEECKGLSLGLTWGLIRRIFSWLDIEEDDPEEIEEIVDLYLASKGKPLDAIDFPDSVKSELITTIEDWADHTEPTEEWRRVYIRLLDELCAKKDMLALKHKAYAYYGGNRLVPCDWKKSEQALLQLAEAGDRYAANSLGYIYYSDRLGAPDYNKAFVYFSKAAEAGIAEARYKLSDLFRKGHGRPKDPDKAFAMLKTVYEEQLASFQDGNFDCKYADTALRMGYCYEEGSGCEQDFRKAHEYYLRAEYAIDLRIRRAMGFGDDVVRKNVEVALDRISAKDTSEEIEIADLPGYPAAKSFERNKRYRMKFMFDWGSGTCLWSTNDAAIAQYDYPVDLGSLPISEGLLNDLDSLIAEHDEALNWDDPAGDLLWTEEQQAAFTKKALKSYDRLREELKDEYEIALFGSMI